MPASAAKNGFSELIERVSRRDTPVLITRNARPTAVMLSVEQFDRLTQAVPDPWPASPRSSTPPWRVCRRQRPRQRWMRCSPPSPMNWGRRQPVARRVAASAADGAHHGTGRGQRRRKKLIAGQALRQAGGEYFNPDEATRRILEANPGLPEAQANAVAWQESVARLRQAIAEGTDYAFETTLGGNTVTGLLLQAAAADTPWPSGIAACTRPSCTWPVSPPA